jgi:hypothetical protein
MQLLADGSPNGLGGCFIPQTPLETIALPLSFTSGIGQVCIPEAETGSAAWMADIEAGVLNSRGWSLQERLLSCRILHW